MTAKQYLRQIRAQNRRIDSLIAEKDRLKQIAEGVSGLSYDRVKVQATRAAPGNRQTDAVYKLIDLEERITAEIDRYVDMRDEAAKYITLMPNDTEQAVLRNYYLSGMKWEQVAELMNYDLRYLFKLHGRALISFSKVMPTK